MGRSVALGAVTAVVVFLCYGALTIVSRLWRAHRGLPPAPRHLGLVTLSAFALSAGMHQAIPRIWNAAAQAAELAMLGIAVLMLPVAAVLALMLHFAIPAPSTRRLAAGGLALLALTATGAMAWSYRQVRVQRALDVQLQRVAARREQHAEVLQRNAELQARLASLRALIEEVIALREGRQPLVAPPPTVRRTMRMPGPPTWDPFAQRQAIEERTRLLDELSADVAKGERLEQARPQLDAQLAEFVEQENALEPLARALRARRIVAPPPPPGAPR